MGAASEIMPVCISPERHIIIGARRRRDFGEPRIPLLILCSATGELCDRLASTSRMCAVTIHVPPMGVSVLEVALSIRHVIRANLARCVGILAGKRSVPRRLWTVQQSGSRTNQCR
jgi:hypothetical protein